MNTLGAGGGRGVTTVVPPLLGGRVGLHQFYYLL